MYFCLKLLSFSWSHEPLSAPSAGISHTECPKTANTCYYNAPKRFHLAALTPTTTPTPTATPTEAATATERKSSSLVANRNEKSFRIWPESFQPLGPVAVFLISRENTKKKLEIRQRRQPRQRRRQRSAKGERFTRSLLDLSQKKTKIIIRKIQQVSSIHELVNENVKKKLSKKNPTYQLKKLEKNPNFYQRNGFLRGTRIFFDNKW